MDGIPVDKLLGSEAEKLLDMEGALHQRLVGQAHAVQLMLFGVPERA